MPKKYSFVDVYDLMHMGYGYDRAARIMAEGKEIRLDERVLVPRKRARKRPAKG